MMFVEVSMQEALSIMADIDHTAIPIDFDPEKQRMVGTAVHGNTPFDVPFISKLADNLYQGGCKDGLILPDYIDVVVSLYPWEKYTIRREDVIRHEYRMYDSTTEPFHAGEVFGLAKLVDDYRKQGKNVLVHCQAGLNRSSLIAGIALLMNGDVKTGEEAIEMIRNNRSPACLCNPAFEAHLRELA